MKIELKKIKHSPSLSRETEAFTADLYINDRHVGLVNNDGHGGSTDYSWNDEESLRLIRQAEKYCASLPEKHYPEEAGMSAFSVPMNFEHYVDDLVADYLRQKLFDRHQKKSILYGHPDGEVFLVTFKVPIKEVLAHPTGLEILKEAFREKVMPNFKEGMVVLNTNIPEKILLGAGLKEGQYRKQVQEQKPLKKQQGKRI